ncbi:MAG: hypothetical protein Q8T13_21250 [Acidobacteriota bacterium]|nr:hypothetical protein [Acidobacteriota bacterium]
MQGFAEALTDAVANFAYAFIPGLDYWQKLPLPMFVRMRTARERLDRVIHRVIAERRTGNPKKGLPPPKPDLISMLLATIAQRWRFARGAHPAPATEPRITLRPKGLTMNAVARSA